MKQERGRQGGDRGETGGDRDRQRLITSLGARVMPWGVKATAGRVT